MDTIKNQLNTNRCSWNWIICTSSILNK